MLSVPRYRRLFYIGVLVVATLFISLHQLVLSKECAISPATQQDFADAVAIGEGIFESEHWQMQVEEQPTQISVGWFDDSLNAVAQSQYYVYNCGYSQEDLSFMYSPETFDAMFANEDAWVQTALCQKQGITLREFEMLYAGRPYTVRHWVNPISDKRVQDIQLGFLQGDEIVLEFYAAKLFPDFMSCTS